MFRFPAAFRLPAFAFRSSDSRRGVGPSSRSAYRPRPDRDGVTTFRTHELRPGWVPPVPRGRRYSSRSTKALQPAPAASLRLVPTPRNSIPSRGAELDEASTRVQAIHPSGLPLACGRRMEQRALGLPPSFEPHRLSTDDAHRGGDRPSSTDLERAHDISRTSNQRVRSSACDLVSQALVVPGRLLLLRMRSDQRRVDIDRQPLRRAMQLPEPCSCPRVRRRTASNSPGVDAIRSIIRNAVESDATGPNNTS